MERPRQVAVIDASPCIGLAHIDELRLLSQLFPCVLLAETVVLELLEGVHLDGAWRILLHPNVEVVAAEGGRLVGAPPMLSVADRDTMALALARGDVDVVVVDDFAARKFGRAQGLRIIGTLGIIALAKTRDLIPLARPLLERLLASGFRLDGRLVDRVLSQLGEAPLGGKPLR